MESPSFLGAAWGSLPPALRALLAQQQQNDGSEENMVAPAAPAVDAWTSDNQPGFDPSLASMGPMAGPPSAATPSVAPAAPAVASPQPPAVPNLPGGGGGGGGGFLSRLGPALQAGITAAATPRIAYGGPVDTLRGLQAAGDQARSRALQQYELQRQGSVDELNRQRVQADIDRAKAESSMYGQHGAYWQARANAAPKDPHTGMQQLNPDYVTGNMPWLLPDKNGEYWVDKTAANTLTKPQARDPVVRTYEQHLVSQLEDTDTPDDIRAAAEKELQTIREHPDKPATTIQGEIVSAYNSGDQKRVNDLIKINQQFQPKQYEYAPERPPKPAGRAQFQAVEARKSNRLLKAEQDAQKTIAKGDQDPNDVYSGLENTKAQIQQDYENEISGLDPNFVPGASPQSMGHPAARAARGAGITAPALGGAAPATMAPALGGAAPPLPAPAIPPAPAVPGPLAVPAARSAAPKIVRIPFHKENLPAMVQKNNTARQARGLPPLTLDQTKRALEAQSYEIQ